MDKEQFELFLEVMLVEQKTKVDKAYKEFVDTGFSGFFAEILARETGRLETLRDLYGMSKCGTFCKKKDEGQDF